MSILKIEACCDELLSDGTNIALSTGDDCMIPEEGYPCYWTGEDCNAHDVLIKYCPFCGTKIQVRRK